MFIKRGLVKLIMVLQTFWCFKGILKNVAHLCVFIWRNLEYNIVKWKKKTAVLENGLCECLDARNISGNTHKTLNVSGKDTGWPLDRGGRGLFCLSCVILDTSPSLSFPIWKRKVIKWETGISFQSWHTRGAIMRGLPTPTPPGTSLGTRSNSVLPPAIKSQ